MAYQYKVAGMPITLEVDPSMVAVRFGAGPSSSKARALVSAGAGTYSERIDLPDEGLSIISAPSAAQPIAWSPVSGNTALLKALQDEDVVDQALPVFRIGNTHAVASDRVIFGTESEDDATSIAEAHGLELIARYENRALARVPSGADAFAVVEALDDDPRTTYAEPDFVMIGTPMLPMPPAALRKFAAAPRDQYALRLSRAIEAWSLQSGRREVKVAILDDGVDVTHPDLEPVVVSTYDAIDGDSYQIPNRWDGHGTACAGLAVANSSGSTGVFGVGRGCSLVAVRIARSTLPGGPWQTTSNTIVNAINWAWRVGEADVISNSWGQQAPSNAMLDALQAARIHGRDGRGAVVVVAAGNSGGRVQFPASLPEVLTVAASNQFDEAKTLTSADMEPWASCFGPEIDVSAPGVQNLTTDVRGAGGYSDGDYFEGFNGTSSATPLVAGACALVLSKRPDLTEAQVREVIRSSADKVGQIPYHGGRNDYLGHGRLNVLAALSAV